MAPLNRIAELEPFSRRRFALDRLSPAQEAHRRSLPAFESKLLQILLQILIGRRRRSIQIGIRIVFQMET